MADLHSALIELRRAGTRGAIDEALRKVLRQARPMHVARLRGRLAMAQAFPGPHRLVAEVEDVLQEIATEIWGSRWTYRIIADHRAADAAKTPERRHDQFWKAFAIRLRGELNKTKSTSRDGQESLSDGTCD